MSFNNTSSDFSEDTAMNCYMDDELDFNSPLLQLACRKNGFKPEDLVKKTLDEIKEIYSKERYSEEAYLLLASHYEERRRQKVKIVLKERNFLIEEKIAEIHPALHYKGKTVVYALGASVNRYKEPKARRELREMIHKQEAELIDLLLQEKELGRNNCARVRAVERQRQQARGAFGLTLYPRPPREIEYIEAEEITRLRAPKKQTKTERKIAKELFEREFGIPYESSTKKSRAKSSQKPKLHKNHIVPVPGDLLETKLMFRQKPATTVPVALSAASQFARFAPDLGQKAINTEDLRPRSVMNGRKPTVVDRNKEKKILFEKGRALTSAFTTPQNSAQKDRLRATVSTFTTPKKAHSKTIEVKPSSTASRIQRTLFGDILESQNKVVDSNPFNYDSDSTDADWERELASTFKPEQRWIDVTRNDILEQSTQTQKSKTQMKANSTSKSFYKNRTSTPQRYEARMSSQTIKEAQAAGALTDRSKFNINASLEVVQFEEVPLHSTGSKKVLVGECPKGQTSKCLGMMYPLSLMSTPVDKKFMQSTFNPDRTGSGMSSTKMYDGASNGRSDGFRSTFLSF